MKIEIPSDATAFDILAGIESWATRAPVSQLHGLWLVLTAMRGPDSGDTTLKGNTTAILRAVALPTLNTRVGALVHENARTYMLQDAVERLADPRNETGDHFMDHVVRAAQVLFYHPDFRALDEGTSNA